MWSTIILILVILIFLLSLTKISLDLKQKKSGSFVLKEGIVLLVIMVVLIILDIEFVGKAKINEKSARVIESEQETTKEDDPRKRLLSQIQDYAGELNHTDKPQVEFFLRRGLEHKTKGEYSEALETFREILDWKLSDGERLAVFILMGNCDMHLKEYDSGINYYHLAEGLCKETGSDSALVAIYSNLALAHRLGEELDGALKNYLNLLEVFRRMDKGSGERSALVNIGSIYQDKGELDSALEYHSKAFEIDSTMGDFMGQATDLTSIGSVLEKKAEFAKAKQFYQRALSLFENIDARREIELVRDKIQRVEEKLKE